MQLAAGAIGVTCAKIGEAEALADAGLTDFFIAHPLVTVAKAQATGRARPPPRCASRHDRR
jgi:D-serine deaminase-like pyridoxal phosphate-dependent protein